MDTNKYQIFLKVLEHRSFSKAAAELGYTQSAVSHSIAVMEKEFGFQLINRKDNKISLTRACIDLLPHIRNVASAQDELDLSLQSYRGIESGTLCIASIMSLPMHFFTELFRRFHEKYPAIHIVCIDGNYEELEEMLSGGRVDFGFTSVTSSLPFEYVPLMRDRLMAVFPTDHPLCAKETVELSDLEDYDFIMPGEGPNHQIGELIRKYGLKLNSPYSVSDDNFTVKMVSDGLGVSILPEMSFKNYLDLPVESRELREKPYRSIGIIYRHWDQLSPLSRILINEAKDFFSKLSPKNSASHLPWFSELDCSGKNQ